MHLVLVLTHDCNLTCGYCYAGRKRAVSMPFETARAAIDLALSRADGNFQLGFFGGEPLLEWDLLVKCTDYAAEQAGRLHIPLRRTVTTNATFLTDSRARWLAGHDFYLGISIDGTKQAHDTFRRFADGSSSFGQCLAGLDSAASAGIDIEAVMVADPATGAWTAESVCFLSELSGVKKISLNLNYEAGNRFDFPAFAGEMERIGDLYVKRYEEGRPFHLECIDGKIAAHIKGGLTCEDWCGFGDGEMAVAPSGRIYPCERLVGDDTRRELSIGTVAEGIDDAALLGMLARRNRRNPECTSCGIRDRCGNHCGCVNFAVSGDVGIGGPVICEFEKICCSTADRAANRLFSQGNPCFLAKFYGETFD